jgi:transposase
LPRASGLKKGLTNYKDVLARVVMHACCCGLDVHKKQIVACLMRFDEAGQRQQELRTFGTMTQDILGLADWLSATGCTHVAMESTGVYWKPVYNLLEGLFELLVVNAQHISNSRS